MQRTKRLKKILNKANSGFKRLSLTVHDEISGFSKNINKTLSKITMIITIGASILTFTGSIYSCGSASDSGIFGSNSSNKIEKVMDEDYNLDYPHLTILKQNEKECNEFYNKIEFIYNDEKECVANPTCVCSKYLNFDMEPIYTSKSSDTTKYVITGWVTVSIPEDPGIGIFINDKLFDEIDVFPKAPYLNTNSKLSCNDVAETCNIKDGGLIDFYYLQTMNRKIVRFNQVFNSVSETGKSYTLKLIPCAFMVNYYPKVSDDPKDCSTGDFCNVEPFFFLKGYLEVKN